MHKIIEETARFVGKQGEKMESQILARQKSNANFAFLNSSDELHPYYLFLRNRISQSHNSITPSAIPPTQSTAQVQVSKSSESLRSIMFSYGEDCDEHVLSLIDKIVEFVKTKANGCAVLKLLRERQSDNPNLSFLKTSDPNHALFVDRLQRALERNPDPPPPPD